LRNIFPSLYAPAANKDAAVIAYREHVSGSCIWSSVFIPDAVVDDATLTLVSLLIKLSGITIGQSLLI